MTVTGSGYTLIEPEALAPLLAKPGNHVVAVAVLDWLAVELTRRLAPDASVEVVRVSYLGRYPALGVRGSTSDLADRARAEVDTLIRSMTLTDLLAFLAVRPEAVSQRHAEVMGSPAHPGADELADRVHRGAGLGQDP